MSDSLCQILTSIISTFNTYNLILKNGSGTIRDKQTNRTLKNDQKKINLCVSVPESTLICKSRIKYRFCLGNASSLLLMFPSKWRKLHCSNLSGLYPPLNSLLFWGV